MSEDSSIQDLQRFKQESGANSEISSLIDEQEGGSLEQTLEEIQKLHIIESELDLAKKG